MILSDYNNLTCKNACFFSGNLKFDDVPCSTITPLGEYAEYQCAVPNGIIFWFVNESSPRALNHGKDIYYTVHFNSNGTSETSVLSLLATELTNNSRIECGVQVGLSIKFSSPALLLVQGTYYRVILINVT